MLGRKCAALIIAALIFAFAGACYGAAEPQVAPAMQTFKLDAGLWRADGNFNSTIRIKNLLVVSAIQVTPVLYFADGAEYVLSPVEIEKAGSADVDVQQAIWAVPGEMAGHVSTFGSVELRYRYPTGGHVVGMVEVRGASHAAFASRFTTECNGVELGQSAEGLWWKREAAMQGFLTAANTGSEPLEASLRLTGSAGTRTEPYPFMVAAHGTANLPFEQLMLDLPEAERQAGGVQINYHGTASRLLASGWIADASGARLAPMSFSLHDAVSAPGLLSFGFVGLANGRPDASQAWPKDITVTPYLYARNATASPITIKWQAVDSGRGKSEMKSLPSIQLAAFETRNIDLPAVLAYAGFEDRANSINLAFSFEGRAGDVILAAGSVNQAGDWALTSEPQQIVPRGKRTASWNSNGAMDTVLWLWNPSDQPEELAVRLEAAAGKGKYRQVIQLAAGESKTVSIGRLLARGLPDRDGNTPPADATGGILGLETSSGGLAPTHVLMASATVGGSINPLDTCYNGIYCCGMSGCGPVPGTFAINVGGTFQLQTHGYDCNGTENFMTSNSDWSSTDGGIATVDNSSNKGLVTGVAVGNVTINAHLPLMQPFTGTICSDPYHTAECPALVAPLVYATGTVAPPPSVSISGPAKVALMQGTGGGPNWITLEADGQPAGGDYSWATTSHNVSLSNSVSGPLVTVTSVAASSCSTPETVTVTYTLSNGAYARATRNITVQKPTQVAKVGTDSTTAEASCGSNPAACGVTRTFNYQVVDQCGVNMVYGGMPFWDSITTGTTNNLNLQSYRTTCANNSGPCEFATDVNGKLPETLTVCAPACVSSGSCTAGSNLYTDATQVWNVNGFPTTVKSLRYQCNQILVNGQ